MTMTHRLCIRAGPSTLEAGRVTTTTTLPPLHYGRRPPPADLQPSDARARAGETHFPQGSEEGKALFAPRESSPAIGLEDEAERAVVATTTTPTTPSGLALRSGEPPPAYSARRFAKRRDHRYRATRRSPARTLAAAADGRTRRGPHEFSLLRTQPRAPPLGPSSSHSGVNPQDSDPSRCVRVYHAICARYTIRKFESGYRPKTR